MLIVASFLIVLIGIVHSYLGERYILIQLFKRDDLPKIFGSDWFTKRVLRFAWHLTTISWWGIAAILIVLSEPTELMKKNVLYVITITFVISGLVSFSFTKGRHISWVVFWLISAVAYYAASSS